MGSVKQILEPWVYERLDSEKKPKILEYARTKSAFYREKLGEIQGDWEAVPFTTDEDLKMRGLEMLCLSQDLIKRVVTLETSGTTGASKRIYSTEADLMQTVEYFRVGMNTFTNPKDKVLILLPCEREGSIGKLLGEALLLSDKKPYLHGIVKNLPETFELIEEIKPDVIVGIPFQVLGLVKYGLYINKEIKTVKKMLLSTDWVSETAVKEIERYWKCEVFRYYGMTESGFGGGIECAHHEGYHLYESDFYIEIIDPVTGICLPDGMIGEIVMTTLRREGMPLIRYRTGDQSRMIQSKCTCGSILRRLDLIKTRLMDQVKLDEGDFTKGEVDDALLDIKTLLDYKICFKRSLERDKDRIELKIYGLAETVEAQMIIERLERIHAIKKAVKDNKLEIGVESIIVDTDYCPHPAKRKIER